jgi:hypothetical protein
MALVKASQDAVLSALMTIDPGLTYEWLDAGVVIGGSRRVLPFLRVSWAPQPQQQ